MREKFLPIGTVCRLKDATSYLMIIGFCVTKEEDPNKIYDYIGCMYPQGMISQNVSFLFDHSQIEEILYEGYVSDIEKEFKNKLNQLIEEKNLEDNQIVNETTIQSNPNIQPQPVVEPNISQTTAVNPQSAQNSSTNSIDLFSTLPSQPGMNDFINNN